jgi:hypothetical protein
MEKKTIKVEKVAENSNLYSRKFQILEGKFKK